VFTDIVPVNQEISNLWWELSASANIEEKRKLLLTMLYAVYFAVKQTWSIVALKPKPPFVLIFQVAVPREGSGIHIIKNEFSNNSKNSSVFKVETGEGACLKSRNPKYFLPLK
jgi:hypothetical protein